MDPGPGWYSILDELHIFIWWQRHRRREGQSLLGSHVPRRGGKLITIYIHDEDLPRVHAILQCVRALFILYTRVAGCETGPPECRRVNSACFFPNAEKEEDTRRRCRIAGRQAGRRLLFPSAWIHMNGQTDLSLLFPSWERPRRWTQTCIVHLWEHGPI